MKVGLSYSRCVRDIVDGVVDIDDVLVLITRTDFDPNNDDQWQGIWIGYGGGSAEVDELRMALMGVNPEWAGYTDEQRFRDISCELCCPTASWHGIPQQKMPGISFKLWPA